MPNALVAYAICIAELLRLFDVLCFLFSVHISHAVYTVYDLRFSHCTFKLNFSQIRMKYRALYFIVDANPKSVYIGINKVNERVKQKTENEMKNGISTQTGIFGCLRKF